MDNKIPEIETKKQNKPKQKTKPNWEEGEKYYNDTSSGGKKKKNNTSKHLTTQKIEFSDRKNPLSLVQWKEKDSYQWASS